MLPVERPGRRATFVLPAEHLRAGGLVARATRAYHSQRAVAFTETLSSGLGRTLVTRWQLERPNRLTYRIRGGSQAIVIGKRRWDRPTAAGKWVPSPQLPVQQPVPLWWQGRITNAYVLDSTPATIEVSFLDRDGPAWFTATFDRRTLLPKHVQMVATAHFMTQKYAPSASPVAIRPPR